MNDLFITDELTENDMVNYVRSVTDKVREDDRVMQQFRNNSAEQAMLGDFPKAVNDSVMGNGDVHQNQMMQLLADPAKGFASVVFDMIRLMD